MKTKYRINKAILAREMPREKSDWEELPIKRIFGGANTYEESLQKLSLAQDTSNIDDTGMSSNDLREQNKKQRQYTSKWLSQATVRVQRDEKKHIQEEK
ncbi:hypothetical protein EAG_12576 [Camponotus floridanus]|uniref:Uncharacterized protein n=1 Tax=Camponotus floridanus TaxID=104421 RepID=E2AL89_CAMFO|nr:hypothetical protein EAG_12576 [Camponotus floridanus]